jgi:hypothetical protein
MQVETKPPTKGAEMGSLLRTVKKRKKSRRLGEVAVVVRIPAKVNTDPRER